MGLDGGELCMEWDGLAAHDGRFVVHGDQPDQVEGRWPGQVIVIRVPSREGASAGLVRVR